MIDTLTNRLHERIAREDMPAYVYTYPPKPAYQPFADSAGARETWRGVSGPLNVYVHIPFCEMKCSFCSLFAMVGGSSSTHERYVQAIRRELELILDGGLDADAVEVRSIYFGGGTPTSLADEQIGELLNGIRARFRIAPGAELAIEASPSSLDESRCAALRALGFTRLSIGVQTFDDGELARMGRHHSGEQAGRMVAAAMAAGFPNVNLDLIYGFEDQTLDGWRRNLETATALGPPTVTIYPLIVRKRTGYGRRFADRADHFARPPEKYEWYDIAVEHLQAAGYRQHTLVTYARERGGCGHEASEFRGVPTLGLGAGARSYAPALHYTNDDYLNVRAPQSTLDAYLEELLVHGRIPVRTAAVLGDDERARRGFILPLLFEGVDRDDYRRRHGEDVECRFGEALEALHDEQCIDDNGASIRLTPRGRRFSSLIAEFLISIDVAGRLAAYA